MSARGEPSIQVIAASCEAGAMSAWADVRNHAAAQLGMPNIAVPPDTGCFWRLLAANNREVARGSDLYADPSEVRDAVAQLQGQRHLISLRTFHGPHSATHGWAAVVRGTVVATCSRWYETEPIRLGVAAASLELLWVARAPRARE